MIIEDSQDKLNFGNNGTKIYSNSYTVFYDCPLKTLYLGRNITYDSGDSGSDWISYSPFSDQSLINITFGECVTEINSREFDGCRNLTSVEIPKNVTKIGDWAFSNCFNLNSIILPSGLSEFGRGAFNYCGFTDFVIPKNIKSIGERAFHGCSKLSSVQFSGNVKIGSNAFQECSNLTAVHAQSIEDWIQINFTDAYANPLTIAKNLYVNDELVTTLSLSAKVKNVGMYSFYGYDKLASLNIANGVESIGSHAFDGCSGLTKLLIPNSVSSIGEYAFANCMGIYSVTSLINIPFKLNETSFAYTGSDYDTNIIYGIAKLYVPRGRANIYGVTSGWKNFISIAETDTKFKLTYMLDGEKYKEYEIQAAEVITPEPDPYKEGYIFSGWSEIPYLMPTQDVTVTGSFTIDPVSVDIIKKDDAAPEAYYSPEGRRLNAPQRGINIIRMSNGTTKKVFVK